MEKQQFEKLDKLADRICDKFAELDKKGAFSGIEEEMNKICSELPEKYDITFRFTLGIFDEEKENEIQLLETGISCFGQNTAYRLQGTGSTPHSYLVNGKISKIPHDYCPACWGRWDFKLKNKTCPGCGAVMGKEVKLMLDSDVCPSCEDGKITRNNPKCGKCGFEVDGTTVYWG